MNPETLSTLNQLAPVAIVVSVTIGVVQLFKNIDVEEQYKRFYPLFSFTVGMLLSYFVFSLDIVLALVTALAASGTYEVTKRSILGIESTTKVKSEDQTPTEPALPSPPPMGSVADFVHPEE
jgi:hypothetical protein